MKNLTAKFQCALLIIVLVAMVGVAMAAEPPNFARQDRYSELTKMHGESFLGLADTTAAAYLSTHDCSSWLGTFVTETWIDSSTAFNTDTVFFDYRTKAYSGGSWSAWARADTATAHQIRRYKQITMPALKPYQIQMRATQLSNSASTVTTPHGRFWAQ